MSESTNPFLDEGVAPIDGDPAYGDIAGDGQTTDQAPEQERQYFELDDDVANRYVKVQVDGETLEVPLREALSGYSRQADYTRKTQDLAEQRRQAEYALTLQRALEAQPEETLRLLARQHGITFEQEVARQQANGYMAPEPDDSFADPLERELHTVKQSLAQMQQQQEMARADQVLRAAIGGLQQRYQLNDADTREVVSRALQMRAGPEAFDMIYKTMAFDRAQAAREEAYRQRQASDARRVEGKQQSQQLVSTGGSAGGAGAPPPDPNEGRMSIAEAFEKAWETTHAGRP